MTKRLLHISANQYPPLQIDHHTKKIWQELAKAFDEYHIIARSRDNKFHHYQEANIYLHLIPKITNRSRIFIITSFYIFRIIRKLKITHLLAQSPIVGGYAAALASKFYKIPLMTEIHGDEYFAYFKGKTMADKSLSRIARYTLRHSIKVRSLSENMTQQLDDIIKANIVLIPNRVNLQLFREPKTSFEIQQPLKLVSIGRFRKAKNYIRLMQDLQSLPYAFELTLIGGGVLKEDYEALIKKNAWKNIMLIDSISQAELADLVIQNDIYLQYSLNEGVPRTILEAMALKMPVISSDAGLIKSVLQHKVNSIIIPKNDQVALIEALKEMVENVSLRKGLAEQAYKDVLEKYEWNKVFDKYRNELSSMTYENS